MPHTGHHSGPEGTFQPAETGKPLQPQSSEVKETSAPQQRVRVLIADDQKIACEVLRRLLRFEENVEVVGTCTSGPEALEAIKQLNPDLVFLDVQMPGLDGFEVVERLPANRSPMIIFVTANESFEGRAARARADFMLKPCTRDRIQAVLRRALARSTRRSNQMDF